MGERDTHVYILDPLLDIRPVLFKLSPIQSIASV